MTSDLFGAARPASALDKIICSAKEDSALSSTVLRQSVRTLFFAGGLYGSTLEERSDLRLPCGLDVAGLGETRRLELLPQAALPGQGKQTCLAYLSIFASLEMDKGLPSTRARFEASVPLLLAFWLGLVCLGLLAIALLCLAWLLSLALLALLGLAWLACLLACLLGPAAFTFFALLGFT